MLFGGADSFIWDSMLSALEVEPRKISAVKGQSSLSHPVTALGIDESRKRLVIISGEGDARVAALAASNIQAANSDFQVVMAWPMALNLGQLAKFAAEFFGGVIVNTRNLELLNTTDLRAKRRLENRALFSKTAEFKPYSSGPTVPSFRNHLNCAWY